jgi:hypothetical protein
MANFTQPIKEAFARYMGRYYDQLVADTKALAEFKGRGLAKSIVWAPDRMVDQVTEMITAWRRNDTSSGEQPTPFVPVMIAAMAKDYTPAPVDFTIPLADPIDVMLPSDTKKRAFKMRTVAAQVRTQVAIVASEESTARSLAMQLHLFARAAANRRMHASYPLAGLDEWWPVVLEMPDLSGVAPPDEAKNLTILTVDIVMMATVPLLMAPTGAASNDGKGDGTDDDPNGYLVVTTVYGGAGQPGGPVERTWTVHESP